MVCELPSSPNMDIWGVSWKSNPDVRKVFSTRSGVDVCSLEDCAALLITMRALTLYSRPRGRDLITSQSVMFRLPLSMLLACDCCHPQGLFVSVVTLLVTLYVLCILAPMNAGIIYTVPNFCMLRACPVVAVDSRARDCSFLFAKIADIPSLVRHPPVVHL